MLALISWSQPTIRRCLKISTHPILGAKRVAVKFPKKRGLNAPTWKGEAFSETLLAEDNGGKWGEATRLRAGQYGQSTNSKHGSYQECRKGGRHEYFIRGSK